MPQPYHVRTHPLSGPQHTDDFRPTGAVGETFPRAVRMDNLSIMSSGRQFLTGVVLPVGASISNITFTTGTTLWTPGTNHWFTLYSGALARLGFTADDGVTAWAANTSKTLYVSRVVTDAVAVNTSAVVTSATAAFTATDVGKRVTFMGAGAAGVPLGTSAAAVTIASVESATSATLSAAASTDVASNGVLYIATPYTTVTTSLHYLGITQVGGTPSTIAGVTHVTGVNSLPTLAPVIAGVSNTGLTVPSSSPDPCTLTGNSNIPYAYVS